MATLWMKFPDEALGNGQFNHAQQHALEAVFSTQASSQWQQALNVIGLKPTPQETQLLAWREGVPYFNWSCMVEILLGSTGMISKTAEGYALSSEYGMKSLWVLMKVHWKIARFIQTPREQMDEIVRSIALGIVLQSLLLRLGADIAQLAAWLAAPDSAPKRHQLTLRQIQNVQMERTALSDAWKTLIGETLTHTGTLPEYFWDDGTLANTPPQVESTATPGRWKGLPVCAGECQGIAVTFDHLPDIDEFRQRIAPYKEPLILVFRNARPEATEFFSYAAAVLFANGGVMSHACTVAREQNLPAVTAASASCFAYLTSHPDTRLHINGATGVVSIL